MARDPSTVYGISSEQQRSDADVLESEIDEAMAGWDCNPLEHTYTLPAGVCRRVATELMRRYSSVGWKMATTYDQQTNTHTLTFTP